MTAFLILGGIGLALVLLSLVLGDVLEGALDGIEAGGVLSTPVIGAFLAAFGFGAALILSSTSAGSGVAALGGLASGAVVGGIALLITRNLIDMPTDETVKSSQLVGTQATVVTPIPDGGLGEVSLVFRGQLMKMGARSSQSVSLGTPVTVTAVTSPSSVVVSPLAPTSETS